MGDQPGEVGSDDQYMQLFFFLLNFFLLARKGSKHQTLHECGDEGHIVLHGVGLSLGVLHSSTNEKYLEKMKKL